MMIFIQTIDMTIQQGIRILLEEAILFLTIDFPFRKRKKVKPTLLALNIDWFTNCNWREQLVAFKQMELYSAKGL